ncbi:MAG: hypothetical protein IKY52_00260 [Clostridia bacterium]|nr:hypothetical protein [Clostridia bacterium]
MKLSLNGTWNLYCIEEKGGKNPRYGWPPDTEHCLHTLEAQVPGNAQLDMYRAGLTPDPFYGDNYYEYIKYENCSFAYCRHFDVDEIPEGEEMILRFDGIDTVADVFVNGEWIGHPEDMFVEHEWNVTNVLRKGENSVCVCIYSAMNYVRAREYPVGMIGTANRNQISYIRKAPHCFGWDIAPRIVTVGLWRDVTLYSRKKTRLTQTYFAVSSANEGAATLRWAFRFATETTDLEEFRITVDGVCGESTFSFRIKPNFTSMNGAHTVRSPKLWWPKGYGEPNLYTVTTRLWQGEEIVDEKTETIGLRSIRLERDFTPGKQKFCFYVNNTPVFCRGTNWVPMDAFHSRAKERIPAAVKLVAEAGCNIIRCWGGGIYEDSLLYDLCDREGIMIWQDFAMGNTTYPQDGSIDALLSDEIEKFLCRVRNHPCICLYASDNEIDQKNMAFEYPEYRVRYNRIAFELLPKLLQAHDPYRFYVRSSPEVPDGFNLENVPEQHTWGPRAWYKDPYYRDCTASFIGEAGYHGCPAPESIRKYIPEEDLWPMRNRSWEAHSTEDLRYTNSSGRNYLMEKQVGLLFAQIPKDLETFSFLSQISQAEALKFFIERARAMKWNRTGIIWWNMIDCWPQISDAVVDYYYVKKLAYTWIARSQTPVLVFVGEASGWQYPLYITNDTRETADVSYTITDADTNVTVTQGSCTVSAGDKVKVCGLDIVISEKRCLLIDYTVNGVPYRNHYLTGLPPYDPTQMRHWADRIL